ncbi:MAG: sigma-70 family RNA polymerase sigma factor [Clostridium sp.]
MEINSENLIRELKRGNEKALDFLYESYLGLAYKITINNLGDIGSREDVEECVSDIFLGVWKNIHRYNENITSFKTWFSSVCKYKAIDYRRRLRGKAVDAKLDEDEIVDMLSVEDKVLISQDMDALNNIIEDMNLVDRQIFIKRYILNEKIDDISIALGITRGAIDNRLSRGRKIIKNKWLQVTGRQCYEQK